MEKPEARSKVSEVDPDEIPSKRPSGRAKGPCPCCDGSRCAEWDFGQIGGGKLAICCQVCGVVLHLAAELIRPPKAEVLEKKGMHSAAMACCGTRKMGVKYETLGPKKKH